MELEQWIRKDMKKFIRSKEKKAADQQPARIEELMSANKDYEQIIKEALRNDRYRYAVETFNELKTVFLDVPLDHQEERKNYYRALSRAYKHIYDYVADRHKTQRIISQIGVNSNVFDQSQKPVDLDRDDNAAPMPSIEELMMRPNAPDPMMPPALEMPQPNANDNKSALEEERIAAARKLRAEKIAAERQIAKEKMELIKQKKRLAQEQAKLKEQQEQASALRAEKREIEERKKREAKQERREAKQAQAKKAKEEEKILAQLQAHRAKEHEESPVPHADVNQFSPAWNVPKPMKKMDIQIPWGKATLHKHTHHHHRHKEFGTTTISNQAMKQAAQTLLNEAKELVNTNLPKAKEKLIEARIEAARAGPNQQLEQDIRTFEKQLAAKQLPQIHPHNTPELFSTAYLRGLHALKQRDYKQAEHYFRQRVQQDPTDRAALIRLKEAMEAMHG